MQTKSPGIHGYALQIQEVTGAPAEILPILERIMREEIFKSTSDWQTARQFNAAARKAHKMYQEDRPYYDAHHAWHAARWQASCAARVLRLAEQAGDPEAIRKAGEIHRAAQTAHDEAYQFMTTLY
jgi:hypothetical protein